MPFAGVSLLTMLELREREYGQNSEEAMDDLEIILALMNRGLLKFFKTQCMQKKVHMLERITGMWDVNDQVSWDVNDQVS